jgi:hypothetical protein
MKFYATGLVSHDGYLFLRKLILSFQSGARFGNADPEDREAVASVDPFYTGSGRLSYMT